MTSHASTEIHAEDLELAERCAKGDPKAFARLKDYEPLLVGILRTRGATEVEAKDIVQNLWGDCVPNAHSNKRNLMTRYSGTSALSTWLATVVTNRLIDSKRRKRIDTVSDSVDEAKFGSYVSSVDKDLDLDPTGSVSDLLHECIDEAINSLNIEHRLMLRLVFIENLQHQEIAQMWGVSNTTITRTFQTSMTQVKRRTMNALVVREPWLQLQWDDFLQIAAHLPQMLF